MKKTLKAFAASFLLLIVAALILALFLKPEYSVSRSIEIQAPASKIYLLTAHFSNWKTWSPWYETEPQAEYIIQGIDGQPGSSMQWNGKLVGKGRIEIAETTEPDFIRYHLMFERPQTLHSSLEIRIVENPSGMTAVTWTNSGKLSYPMGRIFGRFMDEMIGKDFERGLIQLKKTCEKSDIK